jgi:ABC-2 type transport system ATP-binding protein
VSSHVLTEMAVTADHLIVIGRGRLIAESSVAEFIERSSHNYVRVRSPQLERLTQLLIFQGASTHMQDDGSLAVTGATEDTIGELAAAQGIVLHELSPQNASLEDAFMELTHESVDYHGSNASQDSLPRTKVA